MLASAEYTFTNLQKLGEEAINAKLLAALDAKSDGGTNHFARANILRRMGDMAGARAAIAAWLESESAPPGVTLDDWSAIPAGLFTSGGFAVAPIILIDDFLPADRMRALHAHAIERQPHFQKAFTYNIQGPKSYDPERRETLLDPKFTLERDFFYRFVEEKLDSFAASFGLPTFEVDRVELKLSNHVDGGFFKAHKDNHDPVADAGRAVTWLYYFGEPEPRFRGGDLYVLDSKPHEKELALAWFSRIAAKPNRFVAFPSWFYHAVGPTELADNRFEYGRFAVSSHVRKKPDQSIAWWEQSSD